MLDPAQIAPRQTSLPIVAEIERLAHRVVQSPLTELECELLLHHMPHLLTEYRVLREAAAVAPIEDPGPEATADGQPHLISIEGGRND